MVDTRDLKSLGHCARAGSSPASGTTLFFQPLVNEQLARGFYFTGSQRVAKNNNTPPLNPHKKASIIIHQRIMLKAL